MKGSNAAEDFSNIISPRGDIIVCRRLTLKENDPCAIAIYQPLLIQVLMFGPHRRVQDKLQL